MVTSHHWIESTAELQLELRASSEAGVFAQAVRALLELVPEAPTPAGPATQRSVEVEATDRAALLAEWLAELVFLVEKEGLVPEQVSDLVVGEDSVTAVVRGRLGDPPRRVKGVAYHDLELRRDAHGWRGSVVLDVQESVSHWTSSDAATS